MPKHVSTAPRHRRDITPITFGGALYVMDVQNDAACECSLRGWMTCARHNATTYADQQARHATDSLPVLR